MQDLRRYEQATTETRYHVFDFTDDLIAGGALTTATATLTKPDGTTATPTAAVDVAANTVYVQVTSAMLTLTGVYHLQCLATVDNAGTLSNETLEGMRTIIVNY